MSDYAKKRLKIKIRYLFVWLIISGGIWIAVADGEEKKEAYNAVIRSVNNIKSSIEAFQEENGEAAQKEGFALKQYETYWNQVVYEYCLTEKYKEEWNGTTKVDNSYQENEKKKEETNETAKKDEVKGGDNNISEENEAYISAMNNINSVCDDKTYDGLKKTYYVIDSTTSILKEELNKKSLEKDMTIDIKSDDYKVLIYHTHGTEAFSDSEDGCAEDTVVGVGAYLARLLEEEYGIKTYHDETAYDMVGGSLDRSAAYDYARLGVSDILKQYPSIEVVIDIHRDGVADETYLVTEIDGKKTAQLMFLNGMSRLNNNGDIEYLKNENKAANLAFSLQLYLTAAANYENLMRKIFVKGYRYNLDLVERSLLVEVGGQTNTVEEAKNAMEPLAAVLYKVLSGK